MDITVKYTKQDQARLAPFLSGWLKTHAYIRQLDRNEASLTELRKMISIEIHTKRRIQILSRLREHFSALRRELEDKQLFGQLPELSGGKRKTARKRVNELCLKLP